MCIWWGHASSLLWSNVSIFGIPPYQWQIVWWFYQIIVEIGHLGDPGICPVIFSGHCASLSLSAPKWMPEGAAGLGREWEKRKGLSFIRFISSTIWTNTFCNFDKYILPFGQIQRVSEESARKGKTVWKWFMSVHLNHLQKTQFSPLMENW